MYTKQFEDIAHEYLCAKRNYLEPLVEVYGREDRDYLTHEQIAYLEEYDKVMEYFFSGSLPSNTLTEKEVEDIFEQLK